MKHKPTKKSDYVKIEGDKIKRTRRSCPRCGDGIYMSEHKTKDGKTRYYCGRCHYTEWS